MASVAGLERPGWPGESEADRPAFRSRPLAEVIAHVAQRIGRDDALELIAAWFDKPRHWPALNAGDSISESDAEALARAAHARARGAPMQYAVGKANFRNLTLAVDERVLIPRPETELLVDLVLRRAAPGGTAVDVGTGSGAIAIALAMEGKFDRVIATDISLDALELAQSNARRAGARVAFLHSDGLRAFQLSGEGGAQFAAIVSNPPYIAFDEAPLLPASVRDWEPAVALFSAGDGLAVTARLVAQAGDLLQDQGVLALEVDARRAALVARLVTRDPRFMNVSVERDLTGRERFVLGVRRRRKSHD